MLGRILYIQWFFFFLPTNYTDWVPRLFPQVSIQESDETICLRTAKRWALANTPWKNQFILRRLLFVRIWSLEILSIRSLHLLRETVTILKVGQNGKENFRYGWLQFTQWCQHSWPQGSFQRMKGWRKTMLWAFTKLATWAPHRYIIITAYDFIFLSSTIASLWSNIPCSGRFYRSSSLVSPHCYGAQSVLDTVVTISVCFLSLVVCCATLEVHDARPLALK